MGSWKMIIGKHLCDLSRADIGNGRGLEVYSQKLMIGYPLIIGCLLLVCVAILA